MRKAILLLSVLAIAASVQAQPVPSHAYSHADGSFDTINLDGLDGSGLTGISSGFAPPVSSTINIPDSGDLGPGVWSENVYANATKYICDDPDGCDLYLDGPSAVDGQVFTYTFDFSMAGGNDFVQVYNWDSSPYRGWFGFDPSTGSPVFYQDYFNAGNGLWTHYPMVFGFSSGTLYKIIRNDGTESNSLLAGIEDFSSDVGGWNLQGSHPTETSAALSISGSNVSISGVRLTASNMEVAQFPEIIVDGMVNNNSMTEAADNCMMRVQTIGTNGVAGGTFAYMVRAYTGGVAAWETVVGDVKWAAGKISTLATGCAVGTPQEVQQDSGTGNTFTVTPTCAQIAAYEIEFRLNPSTPLVQAQIDGQANVRVNGSSNGITTACP